MELRGCLPSLFDFIAVHQKFENSWIVKLLLIPQILIYSVASNRPSVLYCPPAQLEHLFYTCLDRRIDLACSGQTHTRTHARRTQIHAHAHARAHSHIHTDQALSCEQDATALDVG